MAMSDGRLSVVLADDHMVVRQGLRSFIEGLGGFDVVYEAEDALDAVAVVRRLLPALLVIDIAMPRVTGIEAIEEVRRWSPQTRIVILTGMKTRSLLQLAWDARPDGLFLKSDDLDGWAVNLRAICAAPACAGPAVVSKEVTKILSGTTVGTSLTPRELQILFGIARGETNAAMAQRLGISANTVDRHRTNVMRKLNAHSAAELVAIALREGLLDSGKHV